MDKSYVSDYEQFINGYLRTHPGVEADQVVGWEIYWGPLNADLTPR